MTPHHSHAPREDLTPEHPWGDRGQAVLFVAYMVTWGLDSFVFQLTTFLADGLPWYAITLPGAAIAVVGAVIAGVAHSTIFGKVRDPPRVIDGGVFRISRHPLYLGCIMLFVGSTITTLSLLGAAVDVAIIVFYSWISSYEEGMLEKKYGDEYAAYKARTPMWLIR